MPPVEIAPSHRAARGRQAVGEHRDTRVIVAGEARGRAEEGQCHEEIARYLIGPGKRTALEIAGDHARSRDHHEDQQRQNEGCIARRGEPAYKHAQGIAAPFDDGDPGRALGGEWARHYLVAAMSASFFSPTFGAHVAIIGLTAAIQGPRSGLVTFTPAASNAFIDTSSEAM